MSRNTRVFTSGTPVEHAYRSDVTGVIRGHYFEARVIWYVVDWLTDGFAPCIEQSHVREIASPLHLLATC